MWRAGHDATLKMTVGNVVILDRVPDQKALAERLATAADVAPRLRWRLDDPTRTRSRPSWVDGHDDDVVDHIRHLMVPEPGELRQALDLVALIEPAPFDPSRSPWDVTLIEGLADGRAALYFRADHVLTDGMGGMELVGTAARRAEPGGRGRSWRGVGRGGRQRCRLRVGVPRRRGCPLARRLGRPAGGRPQARHAHDEHRLHERGPTGRGRPRRGSQHRSVRHRDPRLPARTRHRQLGVEAAGGDRRAAVAPHGVALAQQPLRSGLGEWRPYRGARPRRQPQRPSGRSVGGRARPVPRALGHRVPRAPRSDAHGPPPRR